MAVVYSLCISSVSEEKLQNFLFISLIFFFLEKRFISLRMTFKLKSHQVERKSFKMRIILGVGFRPKIKTLLIVTASPQHWKPRELSCTGNLNSAVSLKLLPMLY